MPKNPIVKDDANCIAARRGSVHAPDAMSGYDAIDGESEIGYNAVPTFPRAPARANLPGPADDTESLATIADGLRVLDLVDADETREALESKPHACSYCGIDDALCVVQCVGTGKWFCNSKRNGLPASCAVYHLVRTRSHEVRLHEDSPLGDMVLECYLTGNRNVFTLGFAPCRNDDAVVLLARDAAMAVSAPKNPGKDAASGRERDRFDQRLAAQLRELNLDLDQWQPLVAEKRFLTWLVNVPDVANARRAERVTASRVNKLEELWKTNPEARVADVAADADAADDAPRPVALRYADAYQYQNVFGPLTQLEAEYDKAQREAQSRDGLRVRWDVGLNKRRVAYFSLGSHDADAARIAAGEELILRRMSLDPKDGSRHAWSARGTVVKFSGEDEIGLELRGAGARGAPTQHADGFSVDFVWKSTSFDRAQDAMKAFALDETSVSGHVYHLLLGHDISEPPPPAPPEKWARADVSAPGLPVLNATQQTAVRSALSQPLSLIQGPPGTGKTVTSATVVFHLARQHQGQVIVCAPSNVAVDQLAEKIELTGLRVVRVAAKSREALRSSVEHLTLHYQAARLAEAPGYGELKNLQRLKDELGELDSKDERRYRALRRAIEHEILSAADVVCTTNSGAGDPRLAAFRFRQVLMDESTQATEPESLVPLVMGAKRVVMIGDHCQLGPVVTCGKARAAGLGQSLFERLILLGVVPYRLTVQYRMHPALSEFPSNVFYQGALQNGVSASERSRGGVAFPWPNPSRPMMFWAHFGAEELSASGTSYLNRGEAAGVEQVVTHLLRAGCAPENVGVVTPYEGQRAFVAAHMQRHGPLRAELYADVQVASVDSFQGREKDFIVLSCVRSNESAGIGFLADPRRLNVALTRARLGVIALGNPKALSKQPLFHDLLTHFRENACLVEGPLHALCECATQLSVPRSRGGGVNGVNGGDDRFDRFGGYIPPPGSNPEFAPAAAYDAPEKAWPTGGGGFHAWNANNVAADAARAAAVLPAARAGQNAIY